MNSPVLPYLKIHGSVSDIRGANTIEGNTIRNNLFCHQLFQDLLLISKLAKKPARMKNNGIRHSTWPGPGPVRWGHY